MYEVTAFNYTPPDFRSRIEELEEYMLNQEQVEIPVTHLQAEGMYCREITIPKGTIAIGHAHSEDFIEIVSKGKMLLYSPGKEPIEVKAPHTGIGKAGKRKIGYALEDTVWTTFHHTHETDIKKIEERIIVKSDTFKAHELSEAKI
jgi:hypothetical protein